MSLRKSINIFLLVVYVHFVYLVLKITTTYRIYSIKRRLRLNAADGCKITNKRRPRINAAPNQKNAAFIRGL